LVLLVHLDSTKFLLQVHQAPKSIRHLGAIGTFGFHKVFVASSPGAKEHQAPWCYWYIWIPQSFCCKFVRRQRPSGTLVLLVNLDSTFHGDVCLVDLLKIHRGGSLQNAWLNQLAATCGTGMQHHLQCVCVYAYSVL